MKKYTVTYEETLSRTFIVEADSRDEAVDKMMDAVDRGDVVLTTEDYLYESGHIAEASLASPSDEVWCSLLAEFI